MSCKIDIVLSSSPAELLVRAKNEAEKFNALLEGDEEAGRITLNAMGGKFAGSYLISGQLLRITIFSKPFFLPCSSIAAFLKANIK